MFTLAVDVMGGDLGPHIALRACKKLLRKRKDVCLVISILKPLADEAERYLGHSDRVRILPCETEITNDDKPSRMLRSGLNSTMAAAIMEVKEKRAQAVLSPGNTGALMILSKHLLKTFDGIERPALATLLPTVNKPLLMLDLGANLNVSVEQLKQFAALGWSWSRLRAGAPPKVGLLNVGKEATKGTERLQDADSLIRTMLEDDYIGFCEGSDVFAGELDVLVTDGFVGNVVLKSSESMSHWLINLLNKEFSNHWFRRWLMPLWYTAIKAIERTIAPARHGGALLLGIDGVVVKTHGCSDTRTYLHALNYVLEQLSSYNSESMQQTLNSLQEKAAKNISK